MRRSVVSCVVVQGVFENASTVERPGEVCGSGENLETPGNLSQFSSSGCDLVAAARTGSELREPSESALVARSTSAGSPCVATCLQPAARASTRVRCVSVNRDKNRRYIGQSQSKRPPKRTQRTPHRSVALRLGGCSGWTAPGPGSRCVWALGCPHRRSPGSAAPTGRPGPGPPRSSETFYLYLLFISSIYIFYQKLSAPPTQTRGNPSQARQCGWPRTVLTASPLVAGPSAPPGAVSGMKLQARALQHPPEWRKSLVRATATNVCSGPRSSVPTRAVALAPRNTTAGTAARRDEALAKLSSFRVGCLAYAHNAFSHEARHPRWAAPTTGAGEDNGTGKI
jgi:hypothetical protein